MATIEFFFDYGSPASYLAYTQMPGLAQRTGATIVYRPMLLGGVFKATGNQSPINIPAKGAWMMTDLPRFAKRGRSVIIQAPLAGMLIGDWLPVALNTPPSSIGR